MTQPSGDYPMCAASLGPHRVNGYQALVVSRPHDQYRRDLEARTRPRGSTALVAGASFTVRRVWLRGPYLRSRLAPVVAAFDRLVCSLRGDSARHLYGRHVPRQPAAAEVHRSASASASRLRISGT